MRSASKVQPSARQSCGGRRALRLRTHGVLLSGLMASRKNRSAARRGSPVLVDVSAKYDFAQMARQLACLDSGIGTELNGYDLCLCCYRLIGLQRVWVGDWQSSLDGNHGSLDILVCQLALLDDPCLGMLGSLIPTPGTKKKTSDS